VKASYNFSNALACFSPHLPVGSRFVRSVSGLAIVANSGIHLRYVCRNVNNWRTLFGALMTVMTVPLSGFVLISSIDTMWPR
jgi:hypothetical protein